MNDDDPERRIADLEPPPLDSAVATEPVPDGTGVGLRLGWIVLGLLIAGLLVGGGAILTQRVSHPVAGHPTMTPLIGGGGALAESPSTTASATRPPTPPTTPGNNPPTESTPLPGEAVSVAGVGQARTIVCADNAVSVSGVNNTVVVSGHCSRVDVSGVENRVTVEAADGIVVSGLNNKVTFLSGDPGLINSGLGNTVEAG
jgi:hypothetical protein